MCFIARHSGWFLSMRLAADDSRLAEKVLPTRVRRHPAS
jgi:hypothetical protein